MARKLKSVDVAKFGGTEKLGETEMHGHKHEIESVEAQSDTRLENDLGVGSAVVIRCFTFGANPEAFKDHLPTKQELFNFHWKGIQMALWRDGLAAHPEVEPRLMVNKKATHYSIFVTAKPMFGHTLIERPQTLSEIAHG